MTALRFMDLRHCVARAWPVSVTTALPWPLPSPVCLPRAKRLCRMLTVSRNRTPALRPRSKSSLIRSACTQALRSSVRFQRRGSTKGDRSGRCLISQSMSSDSHRVVAIDGPAASGKSSVARELARRLGFAYVNSGAMYRAITWYVLEHNVDPTDSDRIIKLLESARITCDLQNNQSRILIDDVDPADHLRDDRVNDGVSLVSRVPRVREILVEKMRNYARDNDLVMEGRDIGSVVFPDTPYKFYIDASPEVRSQR